MQVEFALAVTRNKSLECAPIPSASIIYGLKICQIASTQNKCAACPNYDEKGRRDATLGILGTKGITEDTRSQSMQAKYEISSLVASTM